MEKNNWVQYLLVWLLFISATLCAQEHSTPTSDSHIIVKTWISHASNRPVAHEQVLVNIAVMTDTWFTKGTRIHRFEIDNAMVLTNSMSTMNSTERLNGKVYSTQHWQVEAYPLKGGKFKVPSITIDVVTKGERGSSPQTLMTEALDFEVETNNALLKLEHSSLQPGSTLVGHNAQLLEEWTITKQSAEQNTDLQIGDSIERKVTLSAEDTVSMLLPSVVEALSENNTDFISFPILDKTQDEIVRGLRLATKTQTATYVVKQAGQVTLPAITLMWWDTHKQAIQVLKLPEKTWQVSHTLASFWDMYSRVILLTLAAALTVILGLMRLYHYLQNQSSNAWWTLAVSIKRRDIPLYETSMYRILLCKDQRRTLVRGKETYTELDNIQLRYRVHQKLGTFVIGNISRLALVKLSVLLVLRH
jgi:hypothetical protein